MIDLGLTPAQKLDLVDILMSPHMVRNRVYVLDINLQVITEVTGRLLDGAVDMDAEADVTRSCHLKLMNVDNSLGRDFSSPDQGGFLPTRMIRVVHEVARFGNRFDYAIPLFTGPMVDTDQEGGVMSVTCQGKEFFTSKGMFHPWSGGQGWTRGDLIRYALTTFTGEANFRFSPVTSVLGSPWSIGAGEDLFASLKLMARAAGMNLFYDGWGFAILRSKTAAPVFKFDGRVITNEPNPSFSLGDLTNCVRVIGGAPAGYSGQYVYEAFPEPGHPLSPKSLALNGVPRYFPEIIQDDSLNSVELVQESANTLLTEGLLYSYDAQFSSAIIPFLEELDIFTINSSTMFGDRVLKKMSIPLVGDGEMSIGYLSTTGQGPGWVAGSFLSMVSPDPVQKTGKKRKKNKSKNKRKHGWVYGKQVK